MSSYDPTRIDSYDPTRIELDNDPRVLRFRGVAHHGNTPFDVPYMSEVADNLWQGGCAAGLELPTEIRHLVSLYPWERYSVRHQLDTELYVLMYDSTDQGFEQVDRLARWVNQCRETGPVLVHCQAGLNRSSLIAARAITLDSGCSGEEAVAQVRERRSPVCLCNPAFEYYVKEAA